MSSHGRIVSSRRHVADPARRTAMMKSVAVSRALREAAERQRQQQQRQPQATLQARLEGRTAAVAVPVPSLPWLGR